MIYTYGFTVVTPTYNRVHTLPKVYESLRKQTFGDFEWLIIDDGSTDNTNELVLQWQEENQMCIRYVWQSNQHKKTAFNKGVNQAQGELLVALDSDDTIPPTALEDMWQEWHKIPEGGRRSYAAVTGLCVRPNGKIVGDKYPEDSMDLTSIDMYFKYKPKGEKFGCMNTSILRNFPFPEDIEGFVPESLVWRRIARAGYKTRFVNRVFRTYFDSADSLSVQSSEDASKYSLGLILLARDTLVECMPWFFTRPKEFFLSAIRYTRFRLHLRSKGTKLPSLARLRGLPAYILVALMYPLGYYLYRKDISKVSTRS